MLRAAVSGGYAVGYLESWDLASLEAVLDAAEAERSPIIVGFGGMMVEVTWLEARGICMLGAAARAAAEAASVPAAVMFNEAATVSQANLALTSGFNCVLLSTDALSDDEALQATADLTRRAHAMGIAVEAELGHLPDATDPSSCGEMTDPAEAACFVEATGVDCLAVSVGNVHVKSRGWAPIDGARLDALRRAVTVPFAIHGGSSFPPDAVPHAIASGVAKFNVGTVLKTIYWEALSRSVASLGPGPSVSVHDLLGSRKQADHTASARAALTEKARGLMRLYGSAGKAVP
jgi:fructose/tagatose bisphosphate aldolase